MSDSLMSSSRMQGESLTAMGREGDPDFVDRLGRYRDVEGGSLAVKRRTLVVSLLIALGARYRRLGRRCAELGGW